MIIQKMIHELSRTCLKLMMIGVIAAHIVHMDVNAIAKMKGATYPEYIDYI